MAGQPALAPMRFSALNFCGQPWEPQQAEYDGGTTLTLWHHDLYYGNRVGARFYDISPNRRTFAFALDWLDKTEAYGRSIDEAVRRHFANHVPETIIEPGRGMVGGAGMIKAEVVLISRKHRDDEQRWVYLDIGKFGGLAEIGRAHV